MAEITRVPVPLVESFVLEVFRRLGACEADARICTDVLVTADLRGIASHGIGRLKYYFDTIRAGIQFPENRMEIVRESESTALVDGRHGMGHAIAYRCMRLAMDKAKRAGLGAVAVRNGTHFGIAGYYALMAAREGMVGLSVTNAYPAIAPTFGSEPMLGTNPIAFAAPSDMAYPFCFDAATSVVSQGKIEVLDRLEGSAPAGWVVDAKGNPLTDPETILKGFRDGTVTVLPLGGWGEELGGHKGYGLATVVEILSAALSDSAFLKGLSGFDEEGARRPYQRGHFFLAIDVERFVPLDTFRRITGGIMRTLQQADRIPGQARIYVAGEKEHENERRIREQGIPISEKLRRELGLIREALDLTNYEVYF